MAWIQLFAVTLAAVVGAWGGWRLGRTRGWLVGVVLCGIILIGVFIGHRWVRLSFVFPFSWLVNAWANPVILAAAISMLMTLVLVRVPRPSTRRLLTILTGVLILYVAIEPQIMVLAVQPSRRRIQTHFANHGGACNRAIPLAAPPPPSHACTFSRSAPRKAPSPWKPRPIRPSASRGNSWLPPSIVSTAARVSPPVTAVSPPPKPPRPPGSPA